MNILLIDNESTLLEKLQELIPGNEITKRWDDVSLEDASAFECIILSGSIYSVVWNEEKFGNEIKIIKNASVPVVGICFGCELIARAFGGALKELSEKEKGIIKITTAVHDGIFSGRDSFEVFANHRWRVEKIPENFEVLAHSALGPEIIRHKNRPIYGLQFHPENFTDRTFGDEVFLNILNRIMK